MANRIVIGRRNATDLGIFVSRPGQNVLTATTKSMLMATNEPMLQIIHSGQVAAPSAGTYILNLPSYGFQPHLVLMSDRYRTTWTYNSPTQVAISCSNRPYQSDLPALPVKWFALNIPVTL